MDQCKLIVLTFIVTGLWDLILQFSTHYYDKMPRVIQWFDFIESLKTDFSIPEPKLVIDSFKNNFEPMGKKTILNFFGFKSNNFM